MFCPKCGAPLTMHQWPQGRAELYCEPGNMELSQHLRDLVYTLIELHPHRPM